MIYLDHNATTPLDPRVLEAMLPYLQDQFGNAASRQNAPGRRAAAAVDRARDAVAGLLGADPREIVFTSGATEANNLAIFGVTGHPAYGKKRHLVTVATEHRAVLDPMRELEHRGLELTVLPVDSGGHLDPARLAGALRDDTALVSIMHGNNETGVLHDVEALGQLCRERGALLHCDATQTAGKEPLDLRRLPVDLLSLSAHKMHGPQGVGALFVRRRSPRVRCALQLHGGGHERGMRSGTLNLAGIIGLGAAAEIAAQARAADHTRLQELRNELEAELLQRCPQARVNGAAPRSAHTLNVAFPGVDAERLLEALPDLALSTAAACTSAAIQPSYVLGAMGLDDARRRGSVRISVGRFTTRDEIRTAGNLIVEAVTAETA